MRRAADGLLTPGGSEAMRIQLAVAAEVARASVGGGGEGGGGSGARSRRLQRENDADAGGSTCHGHGGTPLVNPVCIPVLTHWAGENTRDVLWNVDLPTL